MKTCPPGWVPWRNRGPWMRDTPDWKKKHPLGPVHFDVMCQFCNSFTVNDISSLDFPHSPSELKLLMDHMILCGNS